MISRLKYKSASLKIICLSGFCKQFICILQLVEICLSICSSFQFATLACRSIGQIGLLDFNSFISNFLNQCFIGFLFFVVVLKMLISLFFSTLHLCIYFDFTSLICLRFVIFFKLSNMSLLYVELYLYMDFLCLHRKCIFFLAIIIFQVSYLPLYIDS